jgi:gluconokinase
MHDKNSLSEGAESGACATDRPLPQGPTIVLMGVAGSGKTTVGRLLGEALSCPFIDADDHHPERNLQKMSRGESLNDDDRRPWLEKLATLLSYHEGSGVVLACSALKVSYRTLLLNAAPEAHLIHLRVSPAELADRLSKRAGHFAKVGLLESQLATFEAPTSGAQVNGELEPTALVGVIQELIASKTKS